MDIERAESKRADRECKCAWIVWANGQGEEDWERVYGEGIGGGEKIAKNVIRSEFWRI